MDYYGLRTFYRALTLSAAFALTGCPTLETSLSPKEAYKQEQRDRQNLDSLQQEIQRNTQRQKMDRP